MYIVIEPGDQPADIALWVSYLEDLANGLKGAGYTMEYTGNRHRAEIREVQAQMPQDILDEVTEGALDAAEALGLDGEAPDEWYGYPYWP